MSEKQNRSAQNSREHEKNSTFADIFEPEKRWGTKRRKSVLRGLQKDIEPLEKEIKRLREAHQKSQNEVERKLLTKQIVKLELRLQNKQALELKYKNYISQTKNLQPDEKNDKFVPQGIGLSGGGIRSATFNLGILQALEKYGVLDANDYMSTVSGGGYIGSCLTWFRSVTRKRDFPFGTERSKCGEAKEGRMLAWLRANGNYLTPGDHLNAWALAAAILTGSVLSLVTIFSVIFVVMYFLNSDFGGTSCTNSLLVLSIFSFVNFFVLVVIFSLTSGCSALRAANFQANAQKVKGAFLFAGVFLFIVGTIPMVYLFVQEHIDIGMELILSSLTAGGGVGIATSLLGGKKSPGKKKSNTSKTILNISLSILVYGLFLWSWHAMSMYESFPSWLGALLLLSVVVAFFAKINHVSMHRFYRNRLMGAYMPNRIAGVKSYYSDQYRVRNISPQTGTPFHIFNTTLQTVDSDNEILKQRGGENFIFSPLYSGSSHTKWVETKDYIDGKMNIATAMAISGAAVDPNTSVTRNRAISFVMTLLNIRLGYWIVNPIASKIWHWTVSTNFAFIRCLFSDLLGTGLNEKRHLVHLSDGGHFENLGLYELLRRKCRTILISDAGADPDRSFSDLAKVISMARIDFGAAIDVPNLDDLRPHRRTGISDSAYLTGTIHYQPEEKDGNVVPCVGTLIYIKPSMVDNLPVDIVGYHDAHPEFPHQSTADQFFDERQFEAYRELGYCLGKQLCNDRKINLI